LKASDLVSSPAGRRPLHPRSPWRGLTQLFAASLIPLSVLLLVIAFGSSWVHQAEMRRLVETRDVRSAAAAARSLEAVAEGRLDLLVAYAAELDSAHQYGIPVDRETWTGWDAGMQQTTPGEEVVELFGSSQEIFANLPQTFPGRSTQASLFTETIADPATGRPLLVGEAPMASGGHLLGALYADSLAGEALRGLVSADDESTVIVVDSASRSLYQAGHLHLLLAPGEHPAIHAARTAQEGTVLLQADDGERVAAYARAGQLGWIVVVEESWEKLLNPFLRTSQAGPLVLAPILLIAVLALVYGTRQVIRPLQALQAKATDLAWGRYDAIEQPVGGIEEIRRLQSEMAVLARKVRSSQQGLRGYINAITAAQEEERRRLARELHDDTLQALIALHQRIQLLRPAGTDSEATRAWEEIQALTRQTMDELRRTARALRPAYLEELGLVSALEALTGETAKTAKIAVEFHIRGEARRLPPEAELALYRMAQESLSNIIRHASAAHAFVDLVFEADRTELHVMDDGKGFDPPESPTDLARLGHFGLMGLQERAQLIGAELNIGSSPGQGTQIRVVLAEPSPRP
jgi:signal transduction histidine kinase